jgi:hypothetical protein
MLSINHLFEDNHITPIQNLPVGKHNHIPDEEFDAKELQMGIKIEFEHTDVPEIAKAIAKDHLAECSTYYTRLIQMEEKCEKEES